MTRAIVRFDNMPVPGYSFSQTAPGVPYVYQLPVLNGPPVPVGRQTYVLVTNTLPPMKAVVESYATLGPEQ